MNVTQCNPLKAKRRFGGTRRLHFQGRRICQARNQRVSGSKESKFFGPEDGGDVFIRNVDWLSTDCMWFISQKIEVFIITAVTTSNPD
jgi:hypothetical protein